MLDTYPIIVPPGVIKDAGRYALRGRWIDSDKMRFRMGKPEGIGGWVRAVELVLRGKCRHLGSWVNISGVGGMFMGTSSKAYVWNASSDVYDVTPVSSSGALANPISTAASSDLVGITLSPTVPKSIGTFIRITGSGAVGGISADLINAEHEIVKIVVDTHFFRVPAVASSTVASGGGGAVSYSLDWPAGNADTFGPAGWGEGTWGSGGWGGEGLSVAKIIGFWTSDNWGQDLLLNPRLGPIFYWNSTTPSTRALAISTFSGASQVPVTTDKVIVWDASRIALAFAANPIGSSERDPLLVRWSDNENYLEWDPTVAGSAAGEFRLSVGSAFVGAMKAPGEILAWTDVGLHSIAPSGGESVFTMRVVSPKTHLYGPKAMTTIGDAVYWAGALGFFRYAGSVQAISCPVEEYMRNRMDRGRESKMVAGANSEFSEIFWFYVSIESPDGEPDSYVKYNVSEDVWDVGTMNRTAWMDSGTFINPTAVTTDGVVLFHEVGVDDAANLDNPAHITRTIQHGPVEIDGKGHNFIATRWLMMDVSFFDCAVPSTTVQVEPSFSYGSGSPLVTSGTINMAAANLQGTNADYSFQKRMRGRGRDLSLRISTGLRGVNWRLGDNRIVGRPDGRR